MKHSIEMVEITAWVKGMNMLVATGIITNDTMKIDRHVAQVVHVFAALVRVP